ncbi:MAG: hypothetical protein RIC95_09280 [Vicingaceae bacterium]
MGQQIVEFFRYMFDTSDWPPRWICGIWSDFHGWLYIGSDTAIWLAYFIIPVIIIWFIQRNPEIPFLPVFWLFGAFIVLCGTTHLMDAIIFWWPAYRLSAFLRFLTAIVSLTTVFALIRDLPKLLRFNGQKLKQNEDDLRQQIMEKDKRIQQLKAQIETQKS